MGLALLFLLAFLIVAAPVGAYPGWVKKGTFLEYRASTYYTEVTVGYNDSGTVVYILGSNITVTFRILNVMDDKALVNVTLYFKGSSDEPVQVEFPANSSIKPFWKQAEVIKEVDNNGVYTFYLKSLEISGKYYIDVNTGWVYDVAGRKYGHTVLWDDLRPNDTFAVYNGMEIPVSRVDKLNISMRTYYASFNGPNVVIHGSPVKVRGGVEIFDGVYNVNHNLCLSFEMFPIPDLETVGIESFWAVDRKSFNTDINMTKGTKDYVNGMWAWGMVLADTNAVGGPSHSEESPLEPWEYAIIGGVIIVLVAWFFLKRSGR